jgi:hypothetical protein
VATKPESAEANVAVRSVTAMPPPTARGLTALTRLVREARRYEANPVIALTILDSPDGGRDILVGVRTITANRTHPQVISTPTQRIPWSFVRHICAGATAIGDFKGSGGTHVLDVQSSSSSEAATRYVVRALFSSKLGVAAELETGRLEYHATLESLTLGTAHYPNLPAHHGKERILMCNIRVTLTKGAELFPESTASYDPLVWVDKNAFIKAVESKDIFLLFPDGDPIELCIYGLCVSTSARLLNAGHQPTARS